MLAENPQSYTEHRRTESERFDAMKLNSNCRITCTYRYMLFIEITLHDQIVLLNVLNLHRLLLHRIDYFFVKGLGPIF